MVDEKSETTHRNDQELRSESVVVSIIGGFELGIDQVHCGIRTSNVDNLEQRYEKANLL